MTQPNQQSGAWIFISHSNRDIEKVREIRNELERRGHNPVLFFLKCIDAKEADDQLLWQLIEREIKAREWFILCDSPNARNSAAVLREMELVRSMEREGKVVETIDLSNKIESELHKIARLSKRATVFISYASPDRDTAMRIRKALLDHDYCVWTYPDDLPPTSNFIAAICEALDEAVNHGFVLHLLSVAALESKQFEREVIYAYQQSTRMNVLPVIVASLEGKVMTATLEYTLDSRQMFDLTTGPFDERIEELIRNLKTREME